MALTPVTADRYVAANGHYGHVWTKKLSPSHYRPRLSCDDGTNYQFVI